MEPTGWRRSSRSGDTGDCVELDATLTAVRDSKNPKIYLRFSREALRLFVAGAQRGEFTTKK
jgi:Domain of unknown function (DUF397)